MSTTEPAALSDALAGRTIALAVERRAAELGAALERHGARILHAPAMSTVHHLDDPALVERTRELIADPPAVVVALTGVGFRGWMEAADAAGLGKQLRTALAPARILARGPKARGAIQQAGLSCAFVADSELAAEVGEQLRREDVAGRRVAVQHHGAGSDGLDELLEELGADVTSLVVYRWGPTPDAAALRESTELAGAGQLDAVLFTAAPGAAAWLDDAREAGVLAALTEQVRAGTVTLAAVGDVTAQPLREAGLDVLVPERWRMGSLIKTVIAHLAAPTDAAGP